KYLKDVPANSRVIIVTEINLIDRLSRECEDKTILDLHYSLCPNMFKINLENLLETIENIGRINVVTVPKAIKKDARAALDRMLGLSR
ncbi:MAG: quinolinate synthase NadA, partial [Thermodesulfobacteriota bacterium]